MSFHLYFLLLLFRSGAPPMTLLATGLLTDPQLPTTASNVCMTDARLDGVCWVAPQTNIMATPVKHVTAACLPLASAATTAVSKLDPNHQPVDVSQ